MLQLHYLKHECVSARTRVRHMCRLNHYKYALCTHLSFFCYLFPFLRIITEPEAYYLFSTFSSLKIQRHRAEVKKKMAADGSSERAVSRKVLQISAGASHSVALLCTFNICPHLFFFYYFLFLLIDHE